MYKLYTIRYRIVVKIRINFKTFFTGETQSKLAESERSKNEVLDRLSKLSNESESIVNQLEAAELKASAAEKAAGTMETQLQETQVCNFE